VVSAKLMGDSPENSRLFSYAVESPGSWVTVGQPPSTEIAMPSRQHSRKKQLP
jgi:hypothetical protein